MSDWDREPVTLPGRLLALAARHPERVALREKRLGRWEERSWREYAEEVHVAARALAGLGVRAGDAVAIISDNRTEWLFVDLAAQALGALSVGIYQTNPPEDVAYIVNHARAKVLFAEDQEQVDKALEIEAPSLERIVVFEPRGLRDYDDPRLSHYRVLIDAARPAAIDDPAWLERMVAERDPRAASMLVYTSGTTGPPKGALLSPYNALSTAAENARRLGASADDSTLSYLPLCHVAEKIFSLFLPLTVGSVVHFGESIDTVREDLREVSPTVFLGVPRIWEKMHAQVVLRMKDSSWLKRRLFAWAMGSRARWLADVLVHRPLQERLGLRRCRIPITGAAPLSVELIEWFRAVGVPILEGYGQTECAGVSHVNAPDATRLGTVGRALPNVEQRLAEDGEVLLRGPNVFLGYLHDEEATRRTIDADGWLHTGDIGEIDAEGYLRITGRKKEIIITAGGKNLSPEKIENALKASPYVKEAVAIGDRRAFIAALVQIDGDAVGDWATRRGIGFTSFEDLSARPEVVKLIDAELAKANEKLARVEQVRAFRLLPKELHQDDGELTATQKVRRRAVLERHSALIEAMYGREAA